MASVHKRGATYYVVYRVDGKQKWAKAGPRKKDADRLKTEIERQLHQGIYREAPDITFKELAGKWLELKKSELRPRSLASYEPMVRRIVAAFGPRKVKTIRQEDVEEFAATMLETASPDLTKRTLTLFKTICAKGIQYGYLYANPVEHVAKPKAPKREMDYLSPEEMAKLIEATDERHRCLIIFACLTGCRQSEILGLRWRNVELESGRVFIRQVCHGGRFYEPKTEKSRRAVAIPPALVKALKAHQLRQAVELESNQHDLVFPNLIGKPMDGHNVTRRILRPALRRAGLREVRFHDLRHSYISMLMNQGANIRFIQQQAGHSSAQITWDRYSHVYPETERAAVLQAESALFGKRKAKRELALTNPEGMSDAMAFSK